MNENKSLILNQPNVITQARYIFSDSEMKVLLFIIKSIQGLLNREDFEQNKVLYGEADYKIFFQLSEIDENETNLTRFKKAIKDLRKRDFEINDAKRWLNVGFVNYGEYNYDLKKWEIQVSHKLMPFMVSMAKGYTRYQLNTILRLNTNSQRLFMMFSQFNETGIFRIKADELRFKLGLEDKYEEYCGFKRRIINTAEKEIKELFEEGQSDIWFKLDSDSKKRGTEDFERMLTFKIFYSQRKIIQADQAKADTLRYCTQIMQSVFPENQSYANSLLGYLVEKKQLKSFSNRLERIEDQAQSEAKPLISFAPLIRHLAKMDYSFISK
ncbi:MAG: RepB family plasmid replication initiator protein [Sphingobacteriaceae bacterium]|nr:MAG: RepB family plasmid replication initiator protein [Sphingobacteriaceae bacterium]